MASRARNKLNTKQIASLAKPGIYADGGGLYLRIRESGRSWFFVGTFRSKRFEMGLGSALDVGLAKARELAAEARGLLVEGRHPLEVRKGARAANNATPSFGKFTELFLDDIEAGFKNPKHRKQWRSTLSTYGASLAHRPIDEIETQDVLKVLQPIWLTKPETASRVRGRIERLLDAAKVKGLRTGENPARGRGHLDLLLPKRARTQVKHHAALPFVEVSAFMAGLQQRDGIAAKALQFAILTAARSGETRGMARGELSLETKVWTVPASRMKANREHQVPLSDAALAILKAVQIEELQPDELVFPAPRGGALSDMSLSAVLRRMGRDDITVHGFRSTFRDWAGDATQFAREDVELALAHTVGSATERAYRRGSALEKRRELMTAWAAFCGPAA